MNMSFGNEIGFDAAATQPDWFAPMPGAIIAAPCGARNAASSRTRSRRRCSC